MYQETEEMMAVQTAVDEEFALELEACEAFDEWQENIHPSYANYAKAHGMALQLIEQLLTGSHE